MKKSLAMMLVLIMVCALPGIASANGGGSINGAGITKDAVFIELQDITFADSVKVELFSDKTLLTTATLNTDKLGASSYPYLTCCIATETADEYWKLTEWTPRDKIVPNKAVLFVDDQEMDTMTFKLDAEKWADLPGTVLPYNGGNTGGGSHWHPPVTPVPVPVVVIPPKTGDMTIWQSILHFFGVI